MGLKASGEENVILSWRLPGARGRTEVEPWVVFLPKVASETAQT